MRRPSGDRPSALAADTEGLASVAPDDAVERFGFRGELAAGRCVAS